MVLLYREETSDDDDWDAAPYEDILKHYSHEEVSQLPPMYPADILAIATRRDPTPVKDLEEFRHVTDEPGRYLGAHDILTALKKDTIKIRLRRRKDEQGSRSGDTKMVEVSRWMY